MGEFKFFFHKIRVLINEVGDMQDVFNSRGCYCDLDVNERPPTHSPGCAHASIMKGMINNLNELKEALHRLEEDIHGK